MTDRADNRTDTMTMPRPWGAGFEAWRARYGRPLLWAALGISLAIHAIGILISMFILFGGGGGSGGGFGKGDDSSGGGGVEMAIATPGGLTSMADAGEQLPLVPTTTATDEVAIPSVIGDSSVSLEGASGLSESVQSLAGGGDVGTGGGFGGGTGGSGGGGGGASFFGVEAQGKRFGFIVDISSSMESEGKFARLKQELRKSISALGENNEYFVVTFSDDSKPMGGKVEWTEATSAANRRMFNVIEALTTGASTRPLPAFQIMFRVRPRPDAIYFMTDGEFEDSVVDEVALLNRVAGGVPIHCICFASQAGEQLMKRIAEQSKGSYTFVPGAGP